MISIINLPSETPSEYFAAPPRSRSICNALFSHKEEKEPAEHTPVQYTPDGKRIGGFLSLHPPDHLWQNALQRSVIYKMEEDGLRLRSKSCNNICKMCDQKISTEKCPDHKKDSLFWKLHDEHSQHHCPLGKLIETTETVMDGAEQILTRVQRSIAKELSELGK